MSAPPRWRVADLAWMPFDRATTLATPRFGRGVIALPATLAGVLQTFTTFRTLEEHVQAARTRFQLDAGRAAALGRDLARLAQSGALLAEDHVHLAAAAAKRGPAAKVTTIAIVTRDRPDLLERAIRGRFACERERALTYVALDDGRDRDAAAALRARLGKLATEIGATIHWAGVAEKEAFAGALAASPELAGSDLGVIRFGLLGEDGLISVGANRNCGRLLGSTSVGYMDDDVTGRSARRGPIDRMAIGSGLELTDFHFFDEDDDAAASAGVAERDLLADHEPWLGKSAGECIAALPPGARVDFDEASSRLLSEIGQAYAAVTSAGIAGDSGMSSAGYYLLLGGENQARLTDHYPRYRGTRSLVRHVPELTLSDGGFFMAPSYCLDERDPLPPFCPVQRNCDGMFAMTLRALGSGALICHLPVVVEHLPSPPRPAFGPGASGSRLGAELYFTPDVFHWAVTSFVFSARTTQAERTAALARHLRDIGGASDATFADFIRLHRMSTLAALATRLEAQAEHGAGGPEFLADIRAEREAVRRAVTGDLVRGPRDLGEDAGAALRARALLRRFGDLVEAWPSMIVAARRLAAEGSPLAAAAAPAS